MKGGSNVVIEGHRHEGVFIARGKEDALVTKNLVPGVRYAAQACTIASGCWVMRWLRHGRMYGVAQPEVAYHSRLIVQQTLPFCNLLLCKAMLHLEPEGVSWQIVT